MDDARRQLAATLVAVGLFFGFRKGFRSLDGVIDVHIDDVTQRARVRWLPDRIRLSEILTAITDIGYVAHPYDASRSQALQKERRRRSTERLIFSGAIGMLVMNFSIATYVMTPEGVDGLPLWITIGRWTGLALTALILAYSGQDFFAGAWNDIRNRRLGMDIPVVLGLMVAWFGSLYTTITEHGEVYFDSIAMFIFLLLLARRWELRGRLRAAARLERLARRPVGRRPHDQHRAGHGRPGRDRPALRRACEDGRQDDDVQVRRQERGRPAQQDGYVHAQADLRR